MATGVYFNTSRKMIGALRQSAVVHETMHNITGRYDSDMETLMGLPDCGDSTICISNALRDNGCAGN